MTFTPDRRDAVAAARAFLRLSGNGPVQDIPVTTEAFAHIGFGRAVVIRSGSSTWDEEYLFEPATPGTTDYRLVRRR